MLKSDTFIHVRYHLRLQALHAWSPSTGFEILLPASLPHYTDALYKQDVESQKQSLWATEQEHVKAANRLVITAYCKQN